MTVLIPCNSTIPIKKSQTFTTFDDNLPAVTIKVFKGERSKTEFNNLLGTCELTEIPPAPRGGRQIKTIYDVNDDGIMNFNAEEESAGNVIKITIKNEKGRLSHEYIDKMVSDAEKNQGIKWRNSKKKVEAKNALEGYCFGIGNSLSKKQIESAIFQLDKDPINKEINDVIAWTDANQNAVITEYAKQKELEGKLMPHMQNAYQNVSSTNFTQTEKSKYLNYWQENLNINDTNLYFLSIIQLY